MEIPGFGPTEAKEKTDPFSRWEREVANRGGRHKAIIAIANKMARTGWVVLAKDLHYDRNCCDDLTTPMRGVLVNKANRC